MKCPVCQERGLKSNVYPGPRYCTLMYCAPYYDEDGNYHNHDMNTATTSYNCSLGHSWTVSRKGECASCDFGKDSERITITNSEEIIPKDPIEFSLTGNGSITVNSATSTWKLNKINKL